MHSQRLQNHDDAKTVIPGPPRPLTKARKPGELLGQVLNNKKKGATLEAVGQSHLSKDGIRESASIQVMATVMAILGTSALKNDQFLKLNASMTLDHGHFIHVPQLEGVAIALLDIWDALQHVHVNIVTWTHLTVTCASFVTSLAKGCSSKQLPQSKAHQIVQDTIEIFKSITSDMQRSSRWHRLHRSHHHMAVMKTVGYVDRLSELSDRREALEEALIRKPPVPRLCLSEVNPLDACAQDENTSEIPNPMPSASSNLPGTQIRRVTLATSVSEGTSTTRSRGISAIFDTPISRRRVSEYSTSSFYTTDRDPRHISSVSLTESLASLRIFDVVDLTGKVEIMDHEGSSIGGFAEVSKGWCSIDGNETEVAIKMLHIIKGDEEGLFRLRKRLAREVRVWTRLSHPNIARFLGVHMTYPAGRPGMVMPWFQHGNASQHLRSRPFLTAEKFTLLYEIARGLAYLHTCSPPIVHGDLKATNVLIDDDGHAVLCDFGLSQIVEEVLEPTGCTTTSTAGSLRWDAPEVVASDAPARLTPASDVWSFGCTGYEIFTGKVPYHQYRGPGPIVSRILEGVPPTWPADDHLNHAHDAAPSSITQQSDNQTVHENGDIPEFVMDFIDLRWKFDPEERGKMNDIVTEMESWLCLLAGTPSEPG